MLTQIIGFIQICIYLYFKNYFSFELYVLGVKVCDELYQMQFFYLSLHLLIKFNHFIFLGLLAIFKIFPKS